jgi:hypothetical protein
VRLYIARCARPDRMSALPRFADSSRTSHEVREWDGPAALPPPTVLRVRRIITVTVPIPISRGAAQASVTLGIDWRREPPT